LCDISFGDIETAKDERRDSPERRAGRDEIRLILALVIAVLVVLVLGFAWAFGSLATRPEAMPPPQIVAPASGVSILASDAVRIDGTYAPGRRSDSPGVLLLHGFGGSRGQMVEQARWLNRLGFAVLAIDFRGHGASEAAPRGLGITEWRDAHAAFDWLKGRQRGARIGVVGISQGGAAALIGPGGPLPADAMVLNAVYPDLRRAIRNRISWLTNRPLAWIAEPLLSYQSRIRFGVWPGQVAPIDSIRTYRGAAMIIGGGADPWTPEPETRALCEAAPRCAELWIVPGLDHLQMSAIDGEAYRARVGAFLSRALEARR